VVEDVDGVVREILCVDKTWSGVVNEEEEKKRKEKSRQKGNNSSEQQASIR